MRDVPLRRSIIGVAVLVALALPGLSRAGNGPAFVSTPTTAATAPTIDGTMGPGEWSVKTSYGIQFGTFPATVYLEHSDTTMYVAVVVQGVPTAPSLDVLFDNNNDGARAVGDDIWLDGSAVTQDFFWDGTTGRDDTTPGLNGSMDTVAAHSIGTGDVTFELSHPLCSADAAHDICLSAAGPGGINFQYEPDGITHFDAPGSLADATTWGSLALGADTTAPTVAVTAPAAGSTLSGTIQATANAADNVGVASVKFQLFDGTNKTFYDMGTDTSAPYTSSAFDTSAAPDTSFGNATVYATATDTSGNTFRAGNGVTVSNGAAASGTLTGALTTPQSFSNLSLTSAGGEDWAIWGYGNGGTSTSLTPDERKNGGSAISGLSYVPATPPATIGGVRPFGKLSPNPYTFAWTDGAPDASVTGAHAGLTDPGVSYGVSFTVPADTNPRTLTLWTTAHYADGTLKATLSDGSAGAYTQTFSALGGQFTGSAFGENVPGVFTIHYAAATAGQHLTITWTQTANNNCAGCDDVVLYAAALSRDAQSATGVTAAVSTTGDTVGMSGANDAISTLPLRAFEPTASGTTPAPINGLPINGLPINGLPINGLPINGLPINGLPINGLPINGLPINGLPINGLPINGLPINGLPLDTPGGWEAVLAGTALAGLPLQSVTLQQVLALHPAPQINLGDLDLSHSPLGQLTIGALALGSTPINGLGLPADSLAALVAWCRTAVPAGTADTSCTTVAVGNQSLFTLGLAGAPINGLPINGLPINGLPINGLPINGLPINGLALSASPINGLPINGLPINGLPLGALPINGLPVGIVDCTLVDCTATPAKTLLDAALAHAILPAATLGLLPDGSFTYGELLKSLLAPTSPVFATLTIGDIIAMLIHRADVPWETLSPRLLSVFAPTRPELPVQVGFTVAGTGSGNATVTATLPAGFDVEPNTSRLRVSRAVTFPETDPVVDGHTATWVIPAVMFGTPYTLEFTAWPGADTGPAQITATAAFGTLTSAPSAASVSVTDSFEPNGSANNELTPLITPDVGVQQSAITSRGDVDFYRVHLPPAGTRLLVHLSNLHADYDLALYADATTSVRTGSATGVPLQDGIVGDEAIDTKGGVNSQLTPTALQDVPNPGIPLVQVSPNRGTDDEDVGMVSPGSGDAYIAVFGYNGASSPQPYSLRVTTRVTPALTCPKRVFAHAGEGTLGSLPTIASMPGDLNTLILVNERRIGDTYGTGGESAVVTALNSLAGDTSLGVSGAVVPVEALAQSAYDGWDTNPCDTGAANTIANAIADEIAAVKTQRPGLKYVVFAGGDDQIPYFRLPDTSRIANESGFASAFGRNEYYGALAGGNLLTDDPYLDTRPVPTTGRTLFVPDLIGGRLVEKPSQIVGAVTQFETSTGTLARSSAFVSGYDFVSDGSHRVQTQLDSFLGSGSTRTLITEAWSKNDLFAQAFPLGGPAAINDWNGHYDNHQALAANGNQADLIETTDLTGPHAFSGGVFFTMGCHAGFQTTDAIVGSTSPDALDWAEYFAGTNTSFVGNTGFGLGNTDSVAFSEELMSNLAGNLNGSLSMGEALLRAKRSYYLAHVAYSSYDVKTLSEAELYGLPMYGIGVRPRAVGVPTPAAPTPTDPVLGTTGSTSPTQGALSGLAGTSAQVASFAAHPHFEATPRSGPHGQFFTNDGQVQAPNYRPLQPYVTLPAMRPGTFAHGVIVDSLTSNDVTPFNPANVRPTVDLTANEPEPQFADEAWPAKVPTLVSLDDAGGLQQSLDLATGQFFTDSTSHAGVERQWTDIGGRVTYSTSTDFVPPTVDSIDAFLSSNTVTFAGHFTDRTETGASGTVAFAQVVYDSDNSGTWLALPLQVDASTGTWSAGTSFRGTAVQYFVEACDVGGNCGYSSNKGRYFNAQPLAASSGGGITINPSRAPDKGTFYTGSVDVTASATNGAPVSVSVDKHPFAPATAPVTLNGEGAHIVDAQGVDGSKVTNVFLIDAVAPTLAHTVTPAVPSGANGWYTAAPTVSFTCADDVSGVAADKCAVDGRTPATDHVTLGEAAAAQTVAATATDGAGNVGHDSVTGLKVDLADPTAPAFTGIRAQLYGINDLPSAGAIGCTSTDTASGVLRCVVTGYSSAIGAHTLLATATDNAGRTSTATLTYTVGFVVGAILPPVTAPNNDQGNPLATDLQVFKIKSTVPVKFRLYLDAARTTLMTTPPAGSVARITYKKADASTDSSDAATLLTAPADDGNVFRWTGATDYQYIFNLKTTGLTGGTYWVQLTLYASNGTTILAQSAPQYFVLRP